MNIVFLDAESVGEVNLDALRDQGDLKCYTTSQCKHNVSEKIINADVVISNKVLLNDAVMQQAPKLKLICVAATGYNNIDIAAAQSRNVQVCNVAGYSTTSVAQHVMAMLLNWSTQLSKYQNAVRNGEWQKSELFCLLDYPVFEVTNKTFGVVGYGAIGQATATLANALGMKVIIAERPDAPTTRKGRVSFEQLLAEADIISLHCPLTSQTQNLINADSLHHMKEDAILINTARGGLIDEQALFDALNTKQIQAALLDGLAVEPPEKNHILLDSTLNNIVVSPHTAWASAEARQTLIDEIALNIAAFKQGKLRNQVGER